MRPISGMSFFSPKTAYFSAAFNVDKDLHSRDIVLTSRFAARSRVAHIIR
jgi:hypothetical protein